MSKRNLYIAIAAVVLVAGGIGVYFWWKSTQKPAPQVFNLPPSNPYYNPNQPTTITTPVSNQPANVISNGGQTITPTGIYANPLGPVPTNTPIYLFDPRNMYIVPGQSTTDSNVYNQSSNQFSGYGSWILTPVSGSTNTFTISDSRASNNLLCLGQSINIFTNKSASAPECQWTISPDPSSNSGTTHYLFKENGQMKYLGGADGSPDGWVYSYSQTSGHPQISLQILKQVQ